MCIYKHSDKLSYRLNNAVPLSVADGRMDGQSRAASRPVFSVGGARKKNIDCRLYMTGLNGSQ